MARDTKTKMTKADSVRRSKRQDELNKKKKKTEQSDSDGDDNDGDSESDEMDVHEYRKFLSKIFPSKNLNEKIKAGESLKKIADKKVTLIIGTDHGSVRVKSPAKVIGDKQTTANLRYKHGRNLDYEPKEVLAFKNPKEAGLPTPTINSSFIFAKGDLFLCYPNNYNHFVNYYKNTFQHGGISLEEMIVPIIRMTNK
jgi:hypothetical protein